MEQERAVKILQALAEGIDPHTGEQCPADSVYQHGDTVRALYFALQKLTTPNAKAAAAVQRKGPENAGRPWSPEEDARLTKAFEAGKSPEALAEEHKRSQWAIEARLVKLGKMETTTAPTRFPVKNNIVAERSASYIASLT